MPLRANIAFNFRGLINKKNKWELPNSHLKLIMVIKSPINVSSYAGPCPGKYCKIYSGPIYTKHNVLALSQTFNLNLTPGSKSEQDASDWNLTANDVANLLTKAVTVGAYHDSEWCNTGRAKHIWAACDSYTVDHSWIKNVGDIQPTLTVFYLKFFITKNGNMIAMISNHGER
jgi:hypothetical protein